MPIQESEHGTLILRAPWTSREVEILNRWQTNGMIHPYTCGSGNRTDERHLDGEGVLLATENGWVCPYCDYKQDWAIPFTAENTKAI